MTTDRGEPTPPIPPEQAAATGTMASRISLRQRSGGVIVPVLTVVVAFLIGGVVVAATGHNPLAAYRDIFNGAGLNWFFHPSTNTVHTDAYNLTLSEKRADAARTALIAAGIPADAITTAWKGEAENAVPTADGVKEQANRRDELIVQ